MEVIINAYIMLYTVEVLTFTDSVVAYYSSL